LYANQQLPLAERLEENVSLAAAAAAGLQGEVPQPPHGGSLLAIMVAVSEHKADAKRVIKRDARWLLGCRDHQQLIAELERSPERT
jgi:hypothetical protein